MKLTNLKNLALILLGNSIYALAIAVFILPNGLITGGTTGLGISMEHYFGIPISWFVLIFNAAMFILGAVILGIKFALTTLVSTFYYPLILGVFENIPQLSRVTDDRMLSVVCGGLMIGLGIGIVIRAGASTGGMDIPPLVLKKRFGIPVSVTMYVMDFMVLIAQMTFGDRERILYGLIMVMTYTIILDKVLVIGVRQTQAKIISERYEEISTAIQEKMDRGTTLLYMEGGHSGKQSRAILVVVSGRELQKLNRIVMDIDDQAFMIVSQVGEVRGRGFTLTKKYE